MSFIHNFLSKNFKSFISLLIVFILLSHSPLVLAQTSDKYGVSSYLYDNPTSNDPSAQQFLNPNTKVFRDFINNAKVAKITLDHEPKIIKGNKDRLGLLDGWGVSGIINFGVSDIIPNLALKNNVLEENEVPPDVYMNTTIAGRQGNPFHALCEYDGLSQQECAEKYNLNLATGDINPNQAVTALQRQLPPEEYYKYLQGLANEHLDCLSNNANGANCSAEYFIDKNENINSKDVANLIANTNYKDYKDLSSEDKQKIYSLNTSHALVPIVLHITKNPNLNLLLENNVNKLNFFSVLDVFLNFFKSSNTYGIAWLPKTYSSSIQGQLSLQSQLPPQEFQNHIEDKESESYNPIDWIGVGSIKDAFDKKVNNQTDFSLEKPSVYQNTGGYTNTNPDKKIETKPSFSLKNIFGNEDKFLEEKLYTYTVSLIIPKELDYLEKDFTAIASIFMPPEYLSFPESNLQIPLSDTVEPLVSNRPPQTIIEEYQCEDANGNNDTCYREKTEDVQISYQGEIDNFEGYSPEGTTNNWIFAGTQGLLPYNEPSRSKTTCWGQEYFQNNPTAKKIVEAVDVFNMFNTDSCPEQLKEDASTSLDIDLFVNNADTKTLINNLLAANWKASYQKVVFYFCENSSTYNDTCKQHLFENSCNGQLCYQYIINAAENAVCAQSGPNQGKYLNPYWAIAIALNENGGLSSDKPDGSQKDHFGCDQSGSAGYGTDIPSKTKCMTNTLLGRCGMPDEENLKIYGYTEFYSEEYPLWPLSILYGSTK